ncbi:hypothetical protein AB9M75_06140 [Lactobacillus sp. AN1001]
MAERSTIQNPLTTLLKEKYGISKQEGTLRFTEKDNLFTIFRKTAVYIYKNGDWTPEEQKEAVKSWLESVGWGKVKEIKEGEKPLDTQGNYYIPGERGNLIYKVEYEDPKKQGNKEHYVVLDEDNKNWSRQGQRRIYRDDRPLDWIEGNLNYTVGYGKLTADLIKQYSQNSEGTEEFDLSDLQGMLYQLTESYYSSKSTGIYFNKSILGDLTYDDFMQMTVESTLDRQIDNKDSDKMMRSFTPQALENNPNLKPLAGRNISIERWRRDYFKNSLLNYIQDYIVQTYNLIQQQRYEQDLNKVVRAKAWTEKKQINQATREMMSRTKLNSDFKEIELDNDVDLKNFLKFESESHKLMQSLPKVDGKELPILRLRKLGNYKALGMYVPQLNTMVVDFRTTDQIYQGVTKEQGEIGISSFVHEYGHYLDYQLGSDKKSKSLDNDFMRFVSDYQTNLKELSNNTLGAKELSYFGTPTEVFARGFELWVSEHNKTITNLVGKDTDYNPEKGKIQYRAFTDKMREELFEYLDRVPELTEAKKKMVNKDFSRDIEEKLLLKPEVRNEKELADTEKLKEFSWKILHKWTKTPERLEKLIKVTQDSLGENNPNRLMWFDKYQTEKLPQMVPEKELIKKGFPIQNYQVESVYGFVKKDRKVNDKDRWVSKPVYNLNELKEAAKDNSRDMAILQTLEKKDDKVLPKRNNLDYYQGINAEQVPNIIKNKTLAKTFMRLEHYFLTAELVKENQPDFVFSKEEKELLSDPKILEHLYLDSIKKSKDTKHDILKQIKGQSKSVEKSHSLQKTIAIASKGLGLSR